MARPVTEDARGIIDPATAASRYEHERHDPSPPVARFVAWYWALAWDLGEGSHTQEVLGHPVVNLVFEPHEVTLSGVLRARSSRVLRGRSWALGVMFRPAGFRPLLDRPLSVLTDRQLPAAAVLGPEIEQVGRALVAAGEWSERIAVLDRFLAERLPSEPQPSEATTPIVERIAAERTLLRVDQVAAGAGLSVRQLQRRFADHVGVSPKWVIQRYRLYEAAAAAAAGQEVHWSALAADLGYSDQAHLVRSFREAVGVPPQRYARTVGPTGTEPPGRVPARAGPAAGSAAIPHDRRGTPSTTLSAVRRYLD